jgi:PIN domain nuclease of toxin-antitoxin system
MASATAPFREAPLAHKIARELNLAHQDPTDGFLAATALVLDLTLVTADSELLGLGEIATLANC